MLKVAFLYYRFLDGDGNKVLIGGVETYIQRLITLVSGMGFQPIVFQPARVAFERLLGPAQVFGLPIQHQPLGKQRRSLYESAARHIDCSDLLVFADDHCSIRTEREDPFDTAWSRLGLHDQSTEALDLVFARSPHRQRANQADHFSTAFL